MDLILARLALTLPIFFMAVVIHEYSHGWVAYKLGDPTAKLAGRLTLNPLVHIDAVGTLFLPIFLSIIHSPIIFGWAKPVPVNFFNLHNPKRDMIWVGLAGPFSNLIFAIILSMFLKLNILAGHPLILLLLGMGVLINLILAIFNMIPIPPLDGSRLVMGVLPRKYAAYYSYLEPFGIIILVALLYLGIVGRVIWPLVIYLSGLLGVALP